MRYKYTFMDLFGAPGGFSLGLKLAKIKPLAGVDIDKYGVQTYRFNFKNAIGIEGDLRRITPHELSDKTGISKGDVDIIVGGPPCQGFSTIGRVKIANLAKNGKWDLNNHHPTFIDDPRNVLYKEFVKIISYFKPDIFIMENVPGMISHRNGETVKEIQKDFKTAGYTTEVKVLNAVEFGVPQKRMRVFFIGVHKDADLKVLWPIPTHQNPQNTNDKRTRTIEEYLPENQKSTEKFPKKPAINVWDAIGDLPEPPVANKMRMGDIPLDYEKPPFSEYQQYSRRGSRKIHNHIGRPHKERDIKTFSFMKEGDSWKDLPNYIKEWYGYRDDIFRDKFKKLIRNRPSWTITAHLQKDGYRYIHPVQPRTITVREAARLQSFPDTFIFKGPRTAQFRQVGNAVPPLLARALGLAARAILEGWTEEKLWKEQVKIGI